MNPEVHSLAGAYALDALDDLERAAFDRHLRECEACRAEADELREAAAETLAAEDISVEVIDLRTLRPLDMETLVASVRKTRRAVIADEGWRSGSLAGEIAARLGETLFYDLDAPIARVCSAEVPIPYPKHLEDAAVPQPETIAAAVRGLLGGRAHG